MSSERHPALALPLVERVDYLTVAASMAAADLVLEPSELAMLKELCRKLELPEAETDAVMMAAHRPTATIEHHLEGLKTSELKFALLTDCLTLALVDGRFGHSEQAEVHALATELHVSEEQLHALEEYVQALHTAAATGAHDFKEKATHLANRLAGVGVPLGVVGVLSALSLEVAGVATGLSAIAAGLGIATGFGAVFGLGIGTFLGVKWLKKRMEQKFHS